MPGAPGFRLRPPRDQAFGSHRPRGSDQDSVTARLWMPSHALLPHAEFVVDFVNVMPGTPKSKVKSRIILTPQHAKRFMKALTENIGRFEGANGNIKDLEEIQLPLNFGGPTAQA